MYEIAHYLTDEGGDPFQEWLESLRDRRAQARILVRIERLRSAVFGDCKPLRDGVWELRIDHGPGYRVYYGIAGHQLVLLLAGGDKRRQQKDIARAVGYWSDYRNRTR